MELSIVGFDNNEISDQLDIPLATVEQQFYEIGKKAAELAVASLETGQYPSGIFEVPVKWVERSSIGPYIHNAYMEQGLNNSWC